MGKGLIVLIVIVLVVLMFGGMYVSSKNQMVAKNETIKSNFAEVDNNMKRRADLIPNLVETVKGIAGQEQAVYGEIARARSQLLNAQAPADKIAANNQLTGALGRLLAVVENYPQLRSSENFMRLQDELAGTENRLAVSRKRYNDAIQDYNTFIGQFPNSLFAGFAGFSRNNDYFQAAESEKAVPKVNFGTNPAPQQAPAPNPKK
jgi:LemA protein